MHTQKQTHKSELSLRTTFITKAAAHFPPHALARRFAARIRSNFCVEAHN